MSLFRHLGVGLIPANILSVTMRTFLQAMMMLTVSSSSRRNNPTGFVKPSVSNRAATPSNTQQHSKKPLTRRYPKDVCSSGLLSQESQNTFFTPSKVSANGNTPTASFQPIFRFKNRQFVSSIEFQYYFLKQTSKTDPFQHLERLARTYTPQTHERTTNLTRTTDLHKCVSDARQEKNRNKIPVVARSSRNFVSKTQGTKTRLYIIVVQVVQCMRIPQTVRAFVHSRSWPDCWWLNGWTAEREISGFSAKSVCPWGSHSHPRRA
jgi:hypothetical protein